MTTTSSPAVLQSVHNHVLYLTLNRPDVLNAANNALLLELLEGLKAAGRDPEVRAVVITGAGRGFCAGQDLAAVEERAGSFTEHIERTYNRVILQMRTLEKPVITAVNGVAAGAGASIALAGDVRLWSDAARFIEVFSNIALIPDSGSTWLLPRIVGYHRAFELMALAERVEPGDALRLGLCEHVYPAETFEAEVRAYAERMAARPTRALGLTKRALNYALTHTLEDALQHEAYLQEAASRLEDHQEGVSAFLHKRAPEFKGR
ncbi:2-(1,2-epoxy-1,2-dihydrophenyl)acetyl-CoA isomerase [Deinobacterium chartae]|uniref:2-(1,2-epoxy-1,2-dihydrophenyl)acetyl-CoA isomerase n=1 Tax=Deinobacterium chartae TaxID=521158 RepID=A0A841I2C7_9DEIO|nr:enoyl-CoA hydratase-related protein [Deinobacterium chartae]MBB6099423.1 2-(1,2-epoxy-1,2-dihydrophenyl)acetyl-CoA isomerase [Deinobacterium chartae]